MVAVLAFVFSCTNSQKECVSDGVLGTYKSDDDRQITFSEDTKGYTVKLEDFGMTSGEYKAVCDNGQLKCKIPFAGETVFNFDPTSSSVKFLNTEFTKK